MWELDVKKAQSHYLELSLSLFFWRRAELISMRYILYYIV